MLNFSTLLGIATMYVRYKQLEALSLNESLIIKLNKAGLGLGMISCFGLCVVANFQKSTLIYMHVVGAALTFGIGGVYILVQTVISYKMQPHLHGKRIFWIRLALVLWCGASMLTMFVSSLMLYTRLPGVDLAKKLHWDPKEK
uniref:DNA damage regulated autophagy modulator 2 n=2 Tax=Latimeria chalumnae TaxID=7897 RepID=M3XI93_LATCH